MQPRKSTGLAVLLGGLVLCWVVMGVAGTSNYFDSEDHIGHTQKELYDKGATATIPECVDLVLEWHPECTALSGLCDASVQRVMGACLAGQDRVAECTDIAQRIGDTELGVAECRARGIERRKGQDRECSKSYGSVGHHCKALLPDVFADVKIPKGR
ncbi:MAG: hypothetical protein KDA24_22325 [Deltaproteobacteria bacterium]|nr:hypothetical protein [Deltaproteobacteria bacterium]